MHCHLPAVHIQPSILLLTQLSSSSESILDIFLLFFVSLTFIKCFSRKTSQNLFLKSRRCKNQQGDGVLQIDSEVTAVSNSCSHTVAGGQCEKGFTQHILRFSVKLPRKETQPTVDDHLKSKVFFPFSFKANYRRVRFCTWLSG